jgi:hypothetical protein
MCSVVLSSHRKSQWPEKGIGEKGFGMGEKVTVKIWKFHPWSLNVTAYVQTTLSLDW